MVCSLTFSFFRFDCGKLAALFEECVDTCIDQYYWLLFELLLTIIHIKSASYLFLPSYRLRLNRFNLLTEITNLLINILVCFVLGPNGKQVPYQKSTLRGQTYTVIADDVGEHIIQIMVNGQHINGSPFRSQAYDAKAIQVDNIPDGVVNQPVEFESNPRI